MKIRNFVLAAAILTLASVPAAAQFTSASVDFIKAVKDRNGDKLNELVRNNPTSLFNARDDAGDTALLITINRRDPDWTAYLLNKGADPNLPGKSGDTPLIAASRVGFEEAVEWLIGQGARVDASNKMGETALIIAVQQRQAQIVKVLLNSGANPDKPDSAAGLSARDYAARDVRSRQILQLIETKKPKASSTAR